MPKNPTTPDVPNAEGEGFLQRWSRRKQATQEGAELAEPTADQQATVASEAPEQADTPETDATAEPPPVTEADLENLNYDSDYTKFMGDNVPEVLRRRALRQLWRSNPILANVDGLNDYDDDFTDAAMVVANLQTAHRVGKGFMTDEELGLTDDETENDLDETEDFEDDEQAVATASDEATAADSHEEISSEEAQASPEVPDTDKA